MSENRTEVFVGGAVMALAVGFAIYAGQVAGLSVGAKDGYALTASFRSVEGVTLGTDVRLAGVKIGTVSGLDLNTQTYRAETTVQIIDGIEIPDDSSISVASEGLLGGTFIEVIPGGSPFALAPGDEFFDTQGAVGLIPLLLKFVTGSGSDTGSEQ